MSSCVQFAVWWHFFVFSFAYGCQQWNAAVGPVQAGSTPSFTSPSSLVEPRVLTSVRAVNSREAFELTPPSRLGSTVDALRLIFIVFARMRCFLVDLHSFEMSADVMLLYE